MPFVLASYKGTVFEFTVRGLGEPPDNLRVMLPIPKLDDLLLDSSGSLP